jgi:hypothetical protein
MGDKPSNPWVGMWVRPRETIRAIVQYNPNYLFFVLCLIYGFPMLFQVAQNLSLGDRYPLAAIIAGALIFGVLAGIVMINIAAGLFYWTGKWIGGTAPFLHVRAAVAWANLPSLGNIAIWFVNMAMFGGRIFTRSFIETPFVGSELALIFFLSIVQVILAVWAFIMLLKALGEVQGFSAWKALLNVLIPIFVIFIGISILSWVFTMFAGAPAPH